LSPSTIGLIGQVCRRSEEPIGSEPVRFARKTSRKPYAKGSKFRVQSSRFKSGRSKLPTITTVSRSPWRVIHACKPCGTAASRCPWRVNQPSASKWLHTAGQGAISGRASRHPETLDQERSCESLDAIGERRFAKIGSARHRKRVASQLST